MIIKRMSLREVLFSEHMRLARGAGLGDVSVKAERARRPTGAATALRIQTQRQRDTQCELDVRRSLHKAGVRYRIDCLPAADCCRKAVIVIRSAKVAVFIDGCFWHKSPLHWKPPQRNASWWIEKIESNAHRDQETSELLTHRTCLVIRSWELELAESVVRRIVEAVSARRPLLRNSAVGLGTQQGGTE